MDNDDEQLVRFSLDMDGSMEPDEDGRWVRYEDALDAIQKAADAAAEAAILRLRG